MKTTKHNVGNYRIEIMESGIRFEIELEHPDDGCECYTVTVASEDEPWYGCDEEEWKDYKQAVRTAIEEKYNHSHYWHEVRITATYYYEDKMYKEEF